MSYGFVYMTTNLLNGRKYIGQHKGSEDGGYLGSGKLIWQAIEEYGAKNFSREILCRCESQEELNREEIRLIELHDAVNSEEFYNLAEGGHLPPTRLPHVKELLRKRQPRLITPERIAKAIESRRDGLSRRMTGHGNIVNLPGVKEKISTSTKEAMRRPEVRERYLKGIEGMHQTPEYRAKISESRIGEKNPCYGKVWINNGEVNKRVTVDDFERCYKHEGFLIGRLWRKSE